MLQVYINQSTHLLLSSFALSCEGEEVAALLLGKLNSEKVFVTRASLLPRKQRKKDRVEVGDEDLSKAMQLAESLGLVVVGWFHSHPHIVILPSHVDLRTQLQLQMLERSFVGLIYGCFHENKSRSQRLQVIAFQAQESSEGIKRIDISLDIEFRNQKAIALLTSLQSPETRLDQSSSSNQFSIDISNSDPLAGSKVVKKSSEEHRVIKDIIRESHLIDIAETFLQEELIGCEPRSGLEAVMAAARIAKIQSCLINPLISSSEF